MKFGTFFEIIGPSFSHKVGVARSLAGRQPNGASNHLNGSLAEMYKRYGTEVALVCVDSRIPTDGIIGAVHRIGQSMRSALRETVKGGSAATAAGQAIRKWKNYT